MLNPLKTDYKKDILLPSQNGKRTFDIVDANGNVLFENVSMIDKSNYLQVGDEYDSDVINEQNATINAMMNGTYLYYESYEDYETAYAQGEVPVDSLVIIKDGVNNTITALQVTYNDSTVKAALDSLVNNVTTAANNISAIKNSIGLLNNIPIYGGKSYTDIKTYALSSDCPIGISVTASKGGTDTSDFPNTNHKWGRHLIIKDTAKITVIAFPETVASSNKPYVASWYQNAWTNWFAISVS